MPTAGGFLTPTEFAQWKVKNNRPHATYQGYKSWVGTTRKTRAAANTTPTMGTFQAAVTPTSINQSITDQINASLAGIRASTQAAQDQANQKAKVAQGFALALADMQKNDPQAIKDQYMQTAGFMKSLGSGLTGAVQDAQQAAANAAAEHIQGATGGPVGSYDPAALHNALQYGSVVIPAGSLAGTADLAMASAKASDAARAGKIEDIAQQYLNQTTQLQGQLAAKRAELEAQRPSLVTKAMQDYNSQLLQQRALDVQIGTLQLNQAKSAADQAVAYTNLTGTLHVVRNGKVVDTGVPATGSKAATTQATITAQNTRNDANNRVRQEIADAANQTRLQVADTAAAAKKAAAGITKNKAKAASASQRSAVVKNAYAVGNDTVKKRIQNIWDQLPQSLTAPQQKGEKIEAYQQRHQQAMTQFNQWKQARRAEYVDLVQNAIAQQLGILKYSQDQIRAMAESIVSGFIPAGG